MVHDAHVTRWKGSPDSPSPDRRVLALPGAAYPVQMPGLHLPLRALALDGWEVWHATWDMTGTSDEQRQTMVDAATSAYAAATGHLPTLVVGKSIGTLAAAWVADHAIPAVWTTPLLTHRACAEAIARSTAPALLVAGTEDTCWDDAAAGRAGTQVVRIPGANHGWATGDWRTELDVLRQLTSAVETFARGLPVAR